MSVKFTAQQEMEVELAFEILGALGDFIDKLSDEIISKVQGPHWCHSNRPHLAGSLLEGP